MQGRQPLLLTPGPVLILTLPKPILTLLGAPQAGRLRGMPGTGSSR